jgi:hypothetical protein
MSAWSEASRCRLVAAPHTEGVVLSTQPDEQALRLSVRWDDGTAAVVAVTDVSVIPAAAAEREGPRKRAPSLGAADASVSAALTSEPSADAAQEGSKRQRFASTGYASADIERELESGHGQPALAHLGQA